MCLYLILAVFLFCFFDIYFTSQQSLVSKFVSRFIPYPAVLMNGKLITVHQYNNFWGDYQNYLTPEGSEKNLFLKVLIRNVALEQIITKLNLELELEELNNFYKNNKYLKQNQTEPNDYFLKPLFYRREIIEKITEDEFNLENKKKIELIYADLVENPDLFASYSELYKDDKLGIDGHLIGWLAYGDLPDYLQSRLAKIEVGDFIPITKSISGYHIYKLNGKIDKGEGSYYYQFDQVFLPLQNFDDYLNNFLKQSKILYFFKN